VSEPILYVKTGCPYCAAAMRWLDQHDIDYRKVDVLTNPEAMDELEEVSDQDSTPTLVWDGAVLADFDVEDLGPFVTEHMADES
jgi:glutaredoxin 3